ncbi:MULTISPECIES: Lrp/AsnC family transcriptional regulator [Cupriavidus]|uniref:Transcriptional regulator, AsnC family n=1 Tax=Cupriavidus pinatubonensis (strain JMP 134 / LMG 1197) TaxID=264198 RepID=Q46MU9_CUPPJ|nr:MULTISPECIES: Lrp/AsnC family transcriptional regulator [Cupriavidus]QYY33904.1 Lrp/AsnC family transcriptional regulator [Cupriavidus pinatubonensis]TPQ33243.1 Lrp/AsnC family transcriptional regulator [Cupriavidus pinatubonensis]
MRFDRTDVRILAELQRDARVRANELAERVGLSPSPFYRRIRLLEEEGVIDGYVTLLNQEKSGFPVSAYVQVAIEKKTEERLARFEAAIAKLDEVMECYLMTGSFDYMLRVVSADIAGIERFVMTQLTTIDGVSDISTSLALRRVVYKTALPVRERSTS